MQLTLSDTLARMNQVFPGAYSKPVIKGHGLTFRNGWVKSCPDCDGEGEIERMHSVGDIWASYTGCMECSGNGFVAADPVDFDGHEFSLNGKAVSVGMVGGVLYACDEDDNETVVSIDDLRPVECAA